MRRALLFLAFTLAACGKPAGDGGSPTPFPSPTPASRFAEWRGPDLGAFTMDHAVLESGAARLAPSGGIEGSDTDGRYDGATFTYGTLVSPEIPVEAPFREAIASWEAATPPDTWVEVALSAKIGSRWTKEYVLGVWSYGNEAVDRKSIDGQADADGDVATDTLVLTGDATAFKLRVTLFAAPGASTPRLRALGVVTSGNDVPPALTPLGAASAIDVPMRSQYEYPAGGETWCSPTSTSMVLAYWGIDVPVPDAAAATYDAVYAGTGNWPFNTAWASAEGDGAIRAFVTRLWRIEQLERLTAAGFPVVVSARWSAGEMTGSPLSSTPGHLLVVRGFDANGDVLVNEPAGPDDLNVRYTYARAQFDAAWAAPGRTVYLIHPVDQPLPEDGRLGSW